MTAEDETTAWLPLNLRDTSEEAAAYQALTDGIPHWLERSMWRWLMDRAAQGSMPLIYEIERRLRINLHGGGAELQAQAMLNQYWEHSSDHERLVLLDFLLRDLQRQYEDAESGDRSLYPSVIGDYAVELHKTLTEGGSLWMVTTKPHWGLERRVNKTTHAQVDLVTSAATDAARKVAAAWNACYKPEPNYDIAYRDAVLAVEAVTLPVALPKASNATLGTVVAHIADTVSNWTVAGLDVAKQASGETMLAMLKTLWHNQQRHANADGTIRDVTRPEAEAALGLAVTLVHWFSSGLAHRIDT